MEMVITDKVGQYLDHIGEGLAVAIDPCHDQARHQALQNFVADSPWLDEGMLSRVQSRVMPKLRTQ